MRKNYKFLLIENILHDRGLCSEIIDIIFNYIISREHKFHLKFKNITFNNNINTIPIQTTTIYKSNLDIDCKITRCITCSGLLNIRYFKKKLFDEDSYCEKVRKYINFSLIENHIRDYHKS